MARSTIEQVAADGHQIAISSITLIEAAYLAEKGRIAPEAFDRLLQAIEDDDSVLAEVPVDRHIASALRRVDRSQIPDMPDRIIAATALYLNIPLISRAGRMRLSETATIW
ncbi:MAG: PIN domain-containing protein [Anaerolineae bacterium]|nr:PIN domain-containing protein [Anaerolineae bacterium]